MEKGLIFAAILIDELEACIIKKNKLNVTTSVHPNPHRDPFPHIYPILRLNDCRHMII